MNTDEINSLELKAYGETTERLDQQLATLRATFEREQKPWPYLKSILKDPGFPPADVVKYKITVLEAVKDRTFEPTLVHELRYADWCYIFNQAMAASSAFYPQIAGMGDCYQQTALWNDARISAENAQIYASCAQQLRASLLSIREAIISKRYRTIERYEEQLPLASLGNEWF